MAEIPPLNIKVIVDASGATVGVAKVSAGLDQLSAKAQVTKSRMAGLGATFKTLAGGLIATGGIIALSNALGDIRQGAILMAVAPKPNETPEFQTWVLQGNEWTIWMDRWFDRVEQYYKLA
jgi:hypothetical protein